MNTEKDKVYEIATNSKCGGYQTGLASMMLIFFDKETVLGATATSKLAASVNKELARKLQKPEIKKSKRKRVYVRFEDNI